jgi:hypothetical protein
MCNQYNTFYMKISIPGKACKFHKVGSHFIIIYTSRQARAEHSDIVQHYKENAVKFFFSFDIRLGHTINIKQGCLTGTTRFC